MRRQELYLSASTTGTRVAIVLAASAVVIAGTLAIGQRQVCTALGGRWASDNQACRNEWGGNDGDIPGSFSRGPILFDPRR